MKISKQEMHDRKKIAKNLYNRNCMNGPKLYIKDIKRVEKIVKNYAFGIYHNIDYIVELKKGNGYRINTATYEGDHESIYSAKFIVTSIDTIEA